MAQENEKNYSLKDNGKTRFYFRDGMMWERGHDSGGDNLWRTSISYMAYNDPAFLEGMLACTKWIKKNHVQYYRTNYHNDTTVSRDQVTMFLVAMALSGEDVKKYVKATKWKLSKKYSLTIDMWLWMRALGGSKFAEKLFFVTQIPIAKVYQLWNKSNISKSKFPSYAVHLLAWQIYALQSNSKYEASLNRIVLSMAEDKNYLVRLLLDYPVTQEQINGVKPETGFQWQRDELDVGDHIRELTPEEGEYNTIDVDILKTIYLRSCFSK